MGIDWFRDLVIVISGVVLTGVLIFCAVIFYSLYKRVRFTLDSIEATSATVHRISSYVQDEVARPLIQVVALAEGVRQGIDTFSNLFRKYRGGGKDV